jgi:hypothetical protein
MFRNNNQEQANNSNQSGTTASGQLCSFFFGGVVGSMIYNKCNTPNTNLEKPSSVAPKR